MKKPKPCIRAFLRRLLPLLLLVFFVNIPFHADAAITFPQMTSASQKAENPCISADSGTSICKKMALMPKTA